MHKRPKKDSKILGLEKIYFACDHLADELEIEKITQHKKLRDNRLIALEKSVHVIFNMPAIKSFPQALKNMSERLIHQKKCYKTFRVF